MPESPQPITVILQENQLNIIKIGLGLFLARICQPLFSVLLFTAAARLLSLEVFGLYALLMGMLFIFQLCSVLGLGPVLTREISTNLEATGKWIGSALFILLPASLLVAAIFVSLLSFMSSSAQAFSGALTIAIAMPCLAFLQIAEAAFIAHGRSSSVIVLNFSENLFRIVLSLVLLFLDQGLPGLLAAYVISKLVGSLLAYYLLRRLPGNKKLNVDAEAVSFLIKNTAIYGSMLLLATLYFRIDIITLSIFQGDIAVGIYSAAYRVITLAFIIGDSLVSAFFPAISQALIKNRETARELTASMINFLLLLKLPMVLGLVFIAPFLLPLLFGTEFQPSATILVILAFLLPFNGINGILGFLLNAAKLEKMALKINIVMVFFHATLTSMLSAKYGIKGAAWGLLCSTLTASLVFGWVVSKKLFSLNSFKLFIRITIVLGGIAAFLLIPEPLFAWRLAALPTLVFALWACQFIQVSEIKRNWRLLRGQASA